MAQTIEDIESRTLLQQFHSLYKKQDAIETNIENVDAKVEQEKSDRQTADANLRNDINTNTNKIENNTTQITALQTGKQDKLTAGTNITIDTNNVISASGGLTKVAASDVDSESATNGQVLTANGSGGASWQNASGGSKSYQHTCYTAINQRLIKFIIINNSSPILNSDTIKEYFVNNGFTTRNNSYPIVGTDISGSTGNRILNYVGIFYFSNFHVVYGEKELTIQDGKILVNNDITYSVYSDISYLTDTVVEL